MFHEHFGLTGPRTRKRLRRLNVAIIVASAIVALFVAKGLYDAGQFDGRHWRPFTSYGLWRLLLTGMKFTLIGAFGGIICAMLFGLVFALLRTSTWRPLRVLATIVIEFFRAVPPILLVLFLFMATATYFNEISGWLEAVMPDSVVEFLGIDSLDTMGAVILGIMLYNGSIIAEVFRSGIQAVPTSQWEAGRVIGLSRAGIVWSIVLPQCWEMILPSLITELVVALKTTSLGYVVSYTEILRSTQYIYSAYGNFLQAGAVTLVIYASMNYSLTRLARLMENRRRARSGQSLLTAL